MEPYFRNYYYSKSDKNNENGIGFLIQKYLIYNRIEYNFLFIEISEFLILLQILEK